jgi:hypothetical protein
MPSSPVEPKVLLGGLAMVGSLAGTMAVWFAHCGAGEIRSVDLDGRSEVALEVQVAAMADSDGIGTRPGPRPV